MNKKYMVECLLERLEKVRSMIGKGKFDNQTYQYQTRNFPKYVKELNVRILMRKTKAELKEMDNQLCELIYKYEVL